MHGWTPIDGHRGRCRRSPNYGVAAWQLPVFTHMATSEHVAGWPSSVQPQPNCEHQPCWLLAMDLYVSDELVALVPVVAQADNRVQKRTAMNVALIFFIIHHLSLRALGAASR